MCIPTNCHCYIACYLRTPYCVRITEFLDFVHRLNSKVPSVSETGCVSVIMWKGGEKPALLEPLERANVSHRTICQRNYIIYAPEVRSCRREITGKLTIKIVERHIKT
jgi:hypothetical protein